MNGQGISKFYHYQANSVWMLRRPSESEKTVPHVDPVMERWFKGLRIGRIFTWDDALFMLVAMDKRDMGATFQPVDVLEQPCGEKRRILVMMHPEIRTQWDFIDYSLPLPGSGSPYRMNTSNKRSLQRC